MEVSAPIEVFLSRYHDLPPELRHIFLNPSLDLPAVASAALSPPWTLPLFMHLDPLAADICARWCQSSRFTEALIAFGRVIPSARHFVEYADMFLTQHVEDISRLWQVENENQLTQILLAAFRLLVFDRVLFARHFDLKLLYAGIQHESRPVRYVTIRAICVHLRAADATMEAMLTKYLGTEAVLGVWEGKTIDYTFLSLWEEKRWSDVAKERDNINARLQEVLQPKERRLVREEDLSPFTVCIFGKLMACSISHSTAAPTNALIPTQTTVANVHRFLEALLQESPILITGLAGAGKSSIVTYSANKLHQLESMVTLHLNEQSDAKMLVGMYTSGTTPGTFVWQAGVLTTAVREGRWLFVEDLDRAPNEVISVLLPLIERKELLIPSRGERIQAAHGFKLIATMRTTLDTNGHESLPKRNLIGNRFWNNLSINALSDSELREVVVGRYPILQPNADQIINAYSVLQTRMRKSHLSVLAKTGSARPLTPRDLFKWCQRLKQHFSRHATFSDAQLDEMFLEATNCFIGHLPQGEAHYDLAACIAEQLHIDAARRDHLLNHRVVKLATNAKAVSIGRATLQQSGKNRSPKRHQIFAHSPHSLRLLERLAVSVDNREPVLLVGETGIGKTTCIQHLATTTGQKLVSFNLSQQSESGDLLGGFKPTSVRGLIMPLHEEFDELFNHALSPFAKRKDDNQHFVDLLGKSIARKQWKKVCLMWKSASAEVLKSFEKTSSRTPVSRETSSHHPSKRRRTEEMNSLVETGTHAFYETRWNKFAADVQDLEARLSNKSNAFAFKFVEGTLVKAVRNGHWVLLDEINLATPDTLEALVDLLGSSLGEAPSLLLTESGNIQRVVAHPDFRVFAAMNPATDIGKKDLPAGIRSRFTEIYVDSPDQDIKSLQHVISSYLPSELGPRLVSDVTNLYTDIQKLAQANNLVDGAGQKPHFSLRTLTRTLVYARDVAAPVGAKDGIYRRALYEGFHMSFLTLLDATSEALVAPKIALHLFTKHTAAKAELSKALPKPVDGRAYVQEGQYWLQKGGFDPQKQPHYIITPFVQRNLNNLIRAVSTRKLPILIQGPTSSGKTSMVEYLAKKSGNQFVRINNHEHTDLQEYLGTYVSGPSGQLKFQEGVLVEALRKGHWIVLDELNLAPTDVLEALNRLLDDNRELLIPETQEIVTPHPDFMLFATQNPAGLYGGRKHLSRAFRNRFLELHFDDIPVNELCEILQRRTQIPPSWAQRIVDVYKELSSLRQENRMFEQKSFATLRDLFRWALRKADDKQQLAVNGYMLLAERVRKPEGRDQVRDVIEKVMSRNGPKVQILEQDLYSVTASLDIALYQDQVGPTKGVVWTKSMRRLYTLIANATSNNEPVLLVGETGCGKTTVCQMLADALGKELFVVNAHQNTETGDLIGSQRPIRNRSAIEAQLLENLRKFMPQAPANVSLKDLWTAFAAMSTEAKNAVDSSMAAEIQSLQARSQALFEWSDGSLVHAVKAGQLFLLDEISLADDSVLERLNSVLEPSRTLLLAEKGSTADTTVTASEGFQFLATMNPGGDYGKRELSPALRNRFTEIWVPSLFDLDDILEIVRAKLSAPVASYAEAIVSFSSWFNQRYNSSAGSAISVRDTLSWIEFINKFGGLNPVLAILHGAAMVYVDTLGANPAAMLSIAVDTIDAERRRCIDEISRLLGEDLSNEYFSTPELVTSGTELSLGAFTCPRNSDATEDVSFSFKARTTRTNAMRIFRALQLSKPLLIEGNPGVGKTTLVTAIAKATGHPLVRINLSEQTDLMDLFGSDVPVEGGAVGTFTWRDAPFLTALKNGDWVLLDEMNLASQSVLEGLNACLDHRAEAYIAELDQTFHRHPNFRLFAAQNPHHQGGGRKGLPASFVNRFTVVYADVFKQDDLNLICKQIFPAAEDEQITSLTRFVDKLETDVVQHHRFGALGSPWEFNLRDTIRMLQLQTTKDSLLSVGSPYDFCDIIFRQRFRTETDRQQLDHVFSATTSFPIINRSFYHNLCSDSYQVGLGLLSRAKIAEFSNSTLTPLHVSHLATLEALMICVEANWPVILTGSSGSGKSTILNHLAAITGQPLVTFSMNADIDAMDLVGGYEQADPDRKRYDFVQQITNMLRGLLLTASCQDSSAAERLSSAIPRSFWTALPDENDINDLITSLEAARAPIFDEVLLQLRHLSALPVEIEKAQFDWVDGLLVHALQRGDWLVLDNANLCSSSVLDRLNSLLEPNGDLSINEHPTADGQPRLVKPHPNFRIFYTVDPRNGELSRAMRNRSIELFMLPAQEPHIHRDVPLFVVESAMSRYRNLVSVDRVEMMEHAADHTSFQDFSLNQRFIEQVRLGLVAEPDLQCKAAEALELFSKLDPRWVQQTMDTQMIKPLALLHKRGLQSIHPLNNEIIVRHQKTLSAPTSDPLFLADFFDVFLDLHRMSQAYQFAAMQAKDRRPVTPFDRSFRQKSFHGGRLDDTIRVAPFLKASLAMLMDFTSKCIEIRHASNSTRRVLNIARQFWWDLFHLVTTFTVNNAGYHIHVTLTQRALKDVSANDEQSIALVKTQAQLIDDMGSGTSLSTGRHMEVLWKIFRPPVVPTMQRLGSLQKLRVLADRFDAAIFPLRVPLEDLVRTQGHLQRALRMTLLEDVPTEALISELSGAIDGLAGTNDKEASVAILQQQFEAIYQCLISSGSQMDLSVHSQLALLSGRPTKGDSPFTSLETETKRLQRTLSAICNFAESALIQITPGAIGGGMATSLLKKLHSIGEVPLSHLGQLRTELGLAARVLAWSANDICRDQRHVLAVTLKAHIAEWRQTDLAPHVQSLPDSTDQQNHVQGDRTLGRDLVRYAITCILAYVPDRAFDPALVETTRGQLLIARRSAASDKIASLLGFERSFSGQSQSMRITIAEQKLEELGKDIPDLLIARPDKSQIVELQGDFTRVLEVVRSTSEELGKEDMRIDGSMLQNINLLIQRLKGNYPAYEDIVVPAVRWLQCLWLGLVLMDNSRMEKIIGEEPSSTWVMLHMVAIADDHIALNLLLHSLEDMRLLALAHRVTGQQTFMPLVWEFFDKLFITWEDKMAEEQEKQAKKSSLYTYRGDQEEQDTIEDEEYAELFPDYDDADSKTEKDAENTITRETAVRVATIHGELFCPDFNATKYLLDLVEKRSKSSVSSPQQRQLASALPEVYLATHDAIGLLDSTSIDQDRYNIYQDAHLPEATRLANLVQAILRRFRELQAMDFEHSTVDDVVRLAGEVLAFGHTEPLAKYLTKAEKLYASMYEWEKVSHKGLSASGLLANLTELIVSWRRLELSTWMQLFAIEQRKAEDDAKSWWFVAYENIVANPQRLSSEDIALHAPELLKALEMFFSGATLGQFSTRLQILEQFRQHLAALQFQIPEIGSIYAALSNFLAYYSRFRQPVADALALQRKQLEKQAKEVVQLASWRDTNIEALKQSAKTSHRKLFRLIRKFRAALNSSVGTIIEQGPPEYIAHSAVATNAHIVPQPSEAIVSFAGATCQRSLDWEAVPTRFKNTSATVRLMKNRSTIPEHVDGAEYISDFLDSLSESITELQKATPSQLTEETKDTVKHLKTRKRALFADVLKKMRQMGFQYNLSSSLLAKQGSAAVVFTSLPAVDNVPQMSEAEYHFHRVLSLMPKIRDIQREHSGDLTPAEVQRSTGYLEGILHQIINQRRTLMGFASSLDRVHKYATNLAQLWNEDESAPVKLSCLPDQNAFKIVKQQTTWLELVLRAFSHVVKVQIELGSFQNDAVLIRLQQFLERTNVILGELRELPILPRNLYPEKQEVIQDRARQLLQNTSDTLESLAEDHPPHAPLLHLLQAWVHTAEETNASPGQQDMDSNQHATLSSIQFNVNKTVDTILASVQSLNESWSCISPSGERQAWLMEHTETFVGNLKALSPEVVNDWVDQCFDVLARLPSDEQVTGIALLLMLSPLMAQYSTIVGDHFSQFVELHTSTCRMAHNLSKSFIEIGTKGFCTPPEKTTGDAEQGQEQKLEGGAGLGDGEGAEDISKDIGDDEDLTELAQEPDQKKDGEIEDEKDAVDMADEEMAGELGETTEKEGEGDNEESGDENEDEPQEETGSVDDLGPEAVDEKMWDGGDAADDKNEKQADKSKGKKNEEQMAAEEQQGEAADEDDADQEEGEEGAQEDEAVGQQQGEQMDDYTEETEKLDLPEDMNMDASMGEESDDESMDGLDDVDEEQRADEVDIPDAEEQDQDQDQDDVMEDATDQQAAAEEEGSQEEESSAEDEKDAMENAGEEAKDSNEAEKALQDQAQDAKAAEDAAPSDMQGMGTDANQQNDEKPAFDSRAKQDEGEQGDETEDTGGASGEKGSNLDKTQQDAIGRSEDLMEAAESQPFKKLGDTLEKWFNQHRQIKQATDDADAPTRENKKNADMTDVDFEHLLNEESQAEAQALGTATEDQARNLDEDNAVATNDEDMPAKSFPEDNEEEPDAGYQTAEDAEMADADEQAAPQTSEQPQEGQAKAFIGGSNRQEQERPADKGQEASPGTEDQDAPTPDNITDSLKAVTISTASARALWTQNELKTRPLAATLTEQLRLILAPTLATKLRGDFRTGKRLNIKRIIPYIASSYKRDKIWMRRSVPSKRSYQIFLAVDDSKSMAEHGKRELAFETLALVTKALSMLEVGELCVAGFGESVNVAHPFDKPFTDDSGVEIFSKLAFDQGDTDVRRLVHEAITLFQDARAKASSSAQDLWQLMLVVSDAICRDADAIRRLVRKAQEEKIMIVFVVVDAGATEADGRQVSSIMDLQGAEFKDGQVTMYRYMDVFPFKWWVVVRDVQELPGVLSMALRQWFAEVVDSSS